MTRRLSWIGLALALSLGVASASAQTSATFFAFGIGSPSRPISTTEIPADFRGTLTVSFHGDPGTGCAAQGLCGYSGTVVLRPGPGGVVGVVAYRADGHLSYQAALSLPGGPEGPITAAHVRRLGGGLCGDAQQPQLDLEATIQRGNVDLPLFQAGGMLLSTRCAGPLDGDLTGLAPRLELRLRALLAGHRTIDLSGTRSFAAGGFAGTISSSLSLTLGRPLRQRGARFPKGSKSTLTREVDETLTITHQEGESKLELSGDPNTCQFLDSCAITGSVSAAFGPQDAVGSLTVLGPASRPYRDFLAALGLTRGGNPQGLEVFGDIAWTRGGAVSSNLSQPTPCTSQAPLGPGAIILQPRGSQLVATYTAASPVRTRCPGPAISDGQTLASGSISLRQVGQRNFTLRVSGGGDLTDDGYAIKQHTSLTLTLLRGRLHQRTLRLPG